MNSVEKRALAGLIDRRIARLAYDQDMALRKLREELTASYEAQAEQVSQTWLSQINEVINDAMAAGFHFKAAHYTLAPTQDHQQVGLYYEPITVADSTIAAAVTHEINLLRAGMDTRSLEVIKDELIEELFTADLTTAGAAILAKIPTLADRVPST